ALLSLIMERAKKACQFVVATHSPILMALPKAEILLLDGDAIGPVAYEELEHVSVTKAFLNNPSRFLRRLYHCRSLTDKLCSAGTAIRQPFISIQHSSISSGY